MSNFTKKTVIVWNIPQAAVPADLQSQLTALEASGVTEKALKTATDLGNGTFEITRPWLDQAAADNWIAYILANSIEEPPVSYSVVNNV